MMKKPLIGITMDYPHSNCYSKYPWYALRANYATSLMEYGAMVVPLVHAPQAIDYWGRMLDGLLISGGDFDIDPQLYGKQTTFPNMQFIPSRTNFELAIFKTLYQQNKPILGICGGMQLINVALGGTLIQDIDQELTSPLAHQQPNPRHETSHQVKVTPKSMLHNILQSEEFAVNSAHHQAVAGLGPDLMVCATAPDGVVEAIESSQHKFCLGLQWHPEFLCSQQDCAIIQQFVGACI